MNKKDKILKDTESPEGEIYGISEDSWTFGICAYNTPPIEGGDLSNTVHVSYDESQGRLHIDIVYPENKEDEQER